MIRLFLSVVATLAFLTAGAVAEEFPTKPVTLVIPYAPGAGANDTLGRFTAEKLSKMWKHPVIVENRGGANGVIGASAVIRSKPDGYTMMFTSGAYTMTPATQDVNFDAGKDLVSAGIIGTGQYLIIIGNHVKARTVSEFIAEAKSKELMWGATGGGADIGTWLFMDASGTKMKRVPYKGTSEALTDILGGRLDFTVASVGGATAFVQDKQVKALALTGLTHAEQLPGTPTLKEAGLKNAVLQAWWGVFVPAKTPPEVIEKINASIKQMVDDPETREYFAKQNVTPASMTPNAMQDMVNDELVRWKELVAKQDLKKE